MHSARGRNHRQIARHESSAPESHSALHTLGILGTGALLMYYLDPNRGRRRRALLRDQLTHATHVLSEGSRVTSRDLRQRAQGVLAESRRWLRHEEVSDETLAERVRSHLGRYVSHPHAIAVEVHDGSVTLSGTILAREVDDLIWCAGKVTGVKSVRSQLVVYSDEEARHVSSLQGGYERHGDRFELLQENWSPTARLITGMGGAALVTAGLSRGGIAGLGMLATGIAVLARSSTNRDLGSLLGIGARHGIPVHKTIHIGAPVERVFELWRDPQNLTRSMSRVREVVSTGENRWRWVVQGPAGAAVEWEAEITSVVPNKKIAWRSVPGSTVQHSGVVRFEQDTGGGTRLDIQLEYVPPAGAVGHAVARVFSADPKSELDADMLRFKTMIETGRQPEEAARSMA